MTIIESPVDQFMFDECIRFKFEPDYKRYILRTSNLVSEASVLQFSFLLVDHYKHKILLTSYNPALSQLFRTSGSNYIKSDLLIKHISDRNKQVFTQIIKAINSTIRADILKGDRYYYFTFETTLLDYEGNEKALIFKAIPYQFTGYPDKECPWLTFYLIEPLAREANNFFTLHAILKKENYHFIRNKNIPEQGNYQLLSDIEVRIIRLSADGNSEIKISEILESGLASIKAFKSTILEKLKARSIAEAITILFENGLLK